MGDVGTGSAADARTPSRCELCDARERSICAALPAAGLARLAAASRAGQFTRGQTVFAEGDVAGDVFNIVAGTAKLIKALPDGRQQITGFARRGDLLGLSGSERFAVSAQAVEPLRVCRIPAARLDALGADYPALERRVLAFACHRLDAAQDQMLLLGRMTAAERITRFLLAWAGDPARERGTAAIRLPMTRGEIADHLGLTIETVSRAFTRLRTDGRISTPSPGRVVILDARRMAAEAAGGEPDATGRP